jgi:hypothetical protein
MTPSERADRAKQLQNDPVLIAAFRDIREKLVSQLEVVMLSDVETQHEIALMLQLLKRLQSQLMLYQQDGAIEKHKEKQDSFIRRMRQSLT